MRRRKVDFTYLLSSDIYTATLTHLARSRYMSKSVVSFEGYQILQDIYL